jgi:hypothetical protein
MPSRDMAVATGAMVLFRLLGSAVGVAVGGTILNNQLSAKLANVPDFQAATNIEGGIQQLSQLPPEVRDTVLTAFAQYDSLV